MKGKITDHFLNITLYTGKLLMNDGSYQSKREALNLMNRALHIRTTKHGAHHTLTNCVRKSVKNLRKEIERWNYNQRGGKPASVHGRSYSAINSSTWTNGSKSVTSEGSRTSHQSNIPSQFDQNNFYKGATMFQRRENCNTSALGAPSMYFQGPTHPPRPALPRPPQPRQPMPYPANYHGHGQIAANSLDQNNFYKGATMFQRRGNCNTSALGAPSMYFQGPTRPPRPALPRPPQPRQPMPYPANYHGHGQIAANSYTSAVRAPPSSRSNFSRPGCENCGEPNHRALSCRYGMKLQCRRCFMFGHKAIYCNY